MHPQVAGQVVGAGQIYSTVVTKLTVVVLENEMDEKDIYIKKKNANITHQQVSGFTSNAVVVKIVRRMDLIVIRGRTISAVFEDVRQRSGLNATR